MGNTIAGTATKMLTLLPILAAVYFYDFPSFLATFSSIGALTFLVLALSLFVFGLMLKRKIVAIRLEVSKSNFGWGLMLLSLAVVLYVYGSYSGDVTWFHYESLYVLILAYVALRIGGGVLRSLSPLLLILAFSFPPFGLFPDLLHRQLIAFLSADLVFVAFLVFIGLRFFNVLVPVAMTCAAAGLWFLAPSFASLPSGGIFLVALIPVPLVVLVFPRFRPFVLLPSAKNKSYAISHEHRQLSNGFCSICGWRFATTRTSENVSVWGLVAVLGVAVLLLLPTVPVLAIISGSPHDAFYSSRGPTGSVIPHTPNGWQVNGTTIPTTDTTDSYAIVQVDVPVYHPETKNYTVYFELSTIDKPTSSGPFGGELSGWNRTSNVVTVFGPFQGYLTTYTTSNTTLLAYHGVTQMLFVNGSSFQQYFVGLGFTREFKNSNVASDTAQFQSDLNALWLPSIRSDFSYSNWTTFLYSLDRGAQGMGPVVLLFGSLMVMGWGAYRASSEDERLDEFLTIASTLPEEERWSCLSRLVKQPHHSATSQELALASSGEPSGLSAERADSNLRELEKMHLAKNLLVERGADIVSVWRAPA